MKTALRTFCACMVFMMVSAAQAAAGTSSVHEGGGKVEAGLDRYESLCRMCLELKNVVKGGESVSRQEAGNMINRFISLNRKLILLVPQMTDRQKSRFDAVGIWFSSGIRPKVLDPFRMVEDVAPLPFPGVVPESKDLSLASVPSSSDRSSLTDLYLIAQFAAPDLSGGVMAGALHKRFGGYLSFRSNFSFARPDYSCMMDGTLPNGSMIWSSGRKRLSNMSVNAGVLVKAVRWLDIYAGAGYGWRSLYWQDIDGRWVQVDDWSHRGLSLEAGAILLYRRLAFSAGLSSISFKTAAFTMGVGLKF